jgi:hypothetical protein
MIPATDKYTGIKVLTTWVLLFVLFVLFVGSMCWSFLDALV